MNNPTAPLRAFSWVALLWLAFPAPLPAQFNYETNDNEITITGYTGWTGMLDTRPTALWNPTVPPGSIGLLTNQFGFNITGTANIPVVIEASTNLTGAWVPLQSLTLTNGAAYFSDPQSSNHGQRFYRLSGP